MRARINRNNTEYKPTFVCLSSFEVISTHITRVITYLFAFAYFEVIPVFRVKLDATTAKDAQMQAVKHKTLKKGRDFRVHDPCA